MNPSYKMKNFANPKTMFKSCSNDDEFSTKPVQTQQSRTRKDRKSNVMKVRSDSSSSSASGSGSGSGSGSFKSVTSAACSSNNNNSCVCSTPTTPRSEASDGAYMTPMTTSDGAISELDILNNDNSINNEEQQQEQVQDHTAEEEDVDQVQDDTTEDDDEELPAVPHHPLNSEWTLWYLEIDRSKTWEEMLHEVASFNTVENFWSLINHIKSPSEIKMGSDYCLFKKGIRPMWEDEANVKGGRWVITLNKSNKSDLDNFWLDTMLILIGESCEYTHELCGAVVNIRLKNNKISIWTANGTNEAAALEIGGKLRDGLRMESVYVLQYQLHKDTMVKQGSMVKTIYTR